jgi:hypothetical protein
LVIAPDVIKLTETVERSPTVEDRLVPVTIPLKVTFLVPEVSKNNSNCASPASSVVKTSANKFAVSLPLAAVYRKSTVPAYPLFLPLHEKMP